MFSAGRAPFPRHASMPDEDGGSEDAERRASRLMDPKLVREGAIVLAGVRSDLPGGRTREHGDARRSARRGGNPCCVIREIME